MPPHHGSAFYILFSSGLLTLASPFKVFQFFVFSSGLAPSVNFPVVLGLQRWEDFLICARSFLKYFWGSFLFNSPFSPLHLSTSNQPCAALSFCPCFRLGLQRWEFFFTLARRNLKFLKPFLLLPVYQPVIFNLTSPKLLILSPFPHPCDSGTQR